MIANQETIIALTEGESIKVYVGASQEKLFNDSIAPWSLNTGYTPRPMYNILINTPTSYQENFMCVRKILGDIDFATHWGDGEYYTIESGQCGAGTWYGTGWYDTGANSQEYNLDELSDKFKLLASLDDLKESWLSRTSYSYAQQDSNYIQVNISDINGNSTFYKIKLVPAVQNVDFIADDSFVSEGNLLVSFDNSGVKDFAEDPIVSYSWNWGDGQVSMLDGLPLGNMTHTYENSGTYFVTLTITTESGLTYEVEKEVSVTTNKPPIANAGADFQAALGSVITLDGSKSVDPDGDSLSYEWKNGSTVVGNEVVITMDDLMVGIHTITLTVTDENEANTTDTVEVIITDAILEASMKVKKTGQTKSYDTDGNEVTNDSVKDDGYYSSQVGITPSYTREDTKEVVTDNITGLMWQDDAEARSITKPWVIEGNNYGDTSGDTATTYCSTLTLGGYSDWRLPTVVELQSIVVDGKYDPSIDTSVFGNYPLYHYFSSTVSVANEDAAWGVYFGSGGTNSTLQYNNNHVRCVRAGQ